MLQGEEYTNTVRVCRELPYCDQSQKSTNGLAFIGQFGIIKSKGSITKAEQVMYQYWLIIAVTFKTNS